MEIRDASRHVPERILAPSAAPQARPDARRRKDHTVIAELGESACRQGPKLYHFPIKVWRDSPPNAAIGARHRPLPRRVAAEPARIEKTRFVRLKRYLIALFLIILSRLDGPSPSSRCACRRTPRAIDLTHVVEKHSSQGDRLQVSTAPGSDGIVRRIEVGAKEAGSRPNWIVFALTNDTDEQIERLIVAPHFRLQGSGVIWPDLGSTRISAITASQGFPPEAEDAADADVFRLTLDPGTTVTYVAELRTPNLPQLYLWEPDAYKDKVTSLTLYKGIVIGIAGLLALFLTIVFVVKGAVIFPAAAALAWAVLAYVCIDFGFWDKIFGSDANADRIWRAGAETVLSATLVVFLFAYLNLNRWHVRAWHVAALWLLILVDLDRPRRVRRAGRRRRRAHLARDRRGRRLRAGALSRDAWLRPGHHADPDLVPAGWSGWRRPASRWPAG